MVALLAAAWPLRPQRDEEGAALRGGCSPSLAASPSLSRRSWWPSSSPAVPGRRLRRRRYPGAPGSRCAGVAVPVPTGRPGLGRRRCRRRVSDDVRLRSGKQRQAHDLAGLAACGRRPDDPVHGRPYRARLALNPSASNPDTLPMLLAWVAAIPPGGVRESTYKRFLRVLLPALAIAETLQVYPVAGSQMGIAALTFVPVGALCLADALTSLRAWSVAQGDRALERFGGCRHRRHRRAGGRVRARHAAASGGHQRRRLPRTAGASVPGCDGYASAAADRRNLHRGSRSAARYRCTTFIGYPSIDSLYLWSGIDAPPPQTPDAWIKALDTAQQQRVVNELRAARPTLRHPQRRPGGTVAGRFASAESPLVHYAAQRLQVRRSGRRTSNSACRSDLPRPAP